MFTYLVIKCTVLFVLLKTFACNICKSTHSNERGLECLPCERGFIATDDCQENFTRSTCVECGDGTFMPDCTFYNKNLSCTVCTECRFYKEKCTKYGDAICEDGTRVLVGTIIGFSFVGMFLFLLSFLAIDEIILRCAKSKSKSSSSGDGRSIETTEVETRVKRPYINNNFDPRSSTSGDGRSIEMTEEETHVMRPYINYNFDPRSSTSGDGRSIEMTEVETRVKRSYINDNFDSLSEDRPHRIEISGEETTVNRPFDNDSLDSLSEDMLHRMATLKEETIVKRPYDVDRRYRTDTSLVETSFTTL